MVLQMELLAAAAVHAQLVDVVAAGVHARQQHAHQVVGTCTRGALLTLVRVYCTVLRRRYLIALAREAAVCAGSRQVGKACSHRTRVGQCHGEGFHASAGSVMVQELSLFRACSM
jgi:hypothetical protein